MKRNGIDYEVAPRPITAVYHEDGHVCQNCFRVGACYVVKMNETNFAKPEGGLAEKPVAKDAEMWLCPDCMDTMIACVQSAWLTAELSGLHPSVKKWRKGK